MQNFFLQMAASAPDAPLKARIRLQVTWADDGTPEGSVEEEIRWITTLDEAFEWGECRRVQATERGSRQFIYVPAARDALGQVAALLNGRLWQAVRWLQAFQGHSAQAPEGIQQQFEAEQPARFVMERLSMKWGQLHQADTEATPVLQLKEKVCSSRSRSTSILLCCARFWMFTNSHGSEVADHGQALQRSTRRKPRRLRLAAIRVVRAGV